MSRSKAPIEVLDLTQSSPEPEPKPRPQSRPHAQPRPQPYLKATDYLQAVQTRRNASTNREPTRTAAAPTPGVIHPAHMERLIKTSDPKLVQQVLLDLCEMSPALSHAVARGLAKHSTYAQSIQKKYVAQTNPGRVDMPGPSQTHNPSPTVKIKAQVKEEGFADSDTSTSTAFSETLQIPPRQKSSTKPHTTPGHMFSTKTGASASSHRSYPNQRPISSFAKRLDVQPPIQECVRCHHQFRVGSQNDCFYHDGRKMKSEDNTGRRITRYTCCDGDDIDPPCKQGNHVAPTASALDSLKRHRPDEPSPFQDYKTPRLF